MAQYENLRSFFTAIANAIRNKTGGSTSIQASDFPEEIAAIETGTDVSDTTAVESNVDQDKIFYKADGTRATGTSTKINPVGILAINANGDFNVKQYSTARVNVTSGYKRAKVTNVSASHSGQHYYLTLTLDNLPAIASIKFITPLPVEITLTGGTGGGGTYTNWVFNIFANEDCELGMYLTQYSYDTDDDEYSGGVGFTNQMVVDQITRNSIRLHFNDQWNNVEKFATSGGYPEDTYVYYE